MKAILLFVLILGVSAIDLHRKAKHKHEIPEQGAPHVVEEESGVDAVQMGCEHPVLERICANEPQYLTHCVQTANSA